MLQPPFTLCIMTDETTLERARSLFPCTQQPRLYLDHASTGPLSTRVLGAMNDYLRHRSEGVLDTFALDIPVAAECRSLLATLINAESPERIAFQGSTSDGINVLAGGLTWKTGDSVLVGSMEFPANIYPYLNLTARGVTVDFLESPDGRVTAELIEHGITAHTRVVALSAVQFLSGYRADLATIGDMCRRKGIIFAVDGIQAVGAIRIDVQGMKIDFLAAGGQKWLLSPHGSGFIYVTEEIQSRIKQATLGWLSVAEPFKFFPANQPLAKSARRYEGGSLNWPSLWGMRASLATLQEFGPAWIESHILSITGQLMDGLRTLEGITLWTPDSPSERAGIVTVLPAPRVSVKLVFDRLRAEGITISLREGKLRYSPHFYNSSSDMRRVVALTAKALL